MGCVAPGEKKKSNSKGKFTWYFCHGFMEMEIRAFLKQYLLQKEVTTDHASADVLLVFEINVNLNSKL
jgi:hypothetical protein